MSTRPDITAMLATIPEREKNMEMVVRGLLPQVDRVCVYLNGHESPPEICRHPRVTWRGTCAGDPDIGDAGKFAFDAEGYVLTVDDDLFYPTDYVDTIKAGIDRYGVVSFHGKRYDDLPVESYYRGFSANYRCLDAVEKDVQVHVPGTGVMGYHTDVVRFSLQDFRHPNMADAWVGLTLHRADVPVWCLAHEAGWIRHQPIDLHRTIARTYCNRDSVQTEAVNRLCA